MLDLKLRNSKCGITIHMCTMKKKIYIYTERERERERERGGGEREREKEREMLGVGKFDKTRNISVIVDKSDTYNGFSNDISSLF